MKENSNVKGKKTFKCEICDKKFSQKVNINIHYSSVHEGKKTFKCNICDKCFSRKIFMDRHIASVHV